MSKCHWQDGAAVSFGYFGGAISGQGLCPVFGKFEDQPYQIGCTLKLKDSLSPLPKNRRTYPHHGCTFANGQGIVAAHTHG